MAIKRTKKKAAKLKAPPAAADAPPSKKSNATVPKKKIIGWREWVYLPDLDVGRVKAKIDTGARTSALHAFRITPFTKDGALYVRFAVHPIQRSAKPEIICVALVIDRRAVTDSGGRSEQRYVIRTSLKLGTSRWPIELTLTNRDQMGFRMLIGRQALRRRYLVDTGRSFLARKKKKKKSVAA
jgi:hypothetical protein